MTTRPRVDWPGVRLHVVTGKGGTGKTTVAAALALALACRGKQVLLCEVEGRQGIAQLFDVPPLPYEERRIAQGADARRHGGDVYALAIDAESALLEYLAMYYRLGRAGKALDRFGVIDFATTIAPGVRDVLLTGKVYEAVERNWRSKNQRQYDAVVLDAPPDRPDRPVPQRQQRARRPGQGRADPQPGRQGDGAAALASAPACTWSPCWRTCRCRRPPTASPSCASDGLPVGGVMVNLVRAASSTTRPATRCSSGSLPPRGGRGRPGRGRRRRHPRRWSTGCSREGREHAERRALEDEQRERIAELDVPTYELPRLPDGIDLGGLYELAAELSSRGWHERTTTHRAGVGPLAADADLDRSRSLDVDALLDDPRHPDHRLLRLRRRRQDHHRPRPWPCARPSAAARSCVLTIDPARRLAQSMGIESSTTPRARCPASNTDTGGSLDAMMLDMKRTFDEVVESQASPEKAAQILSNPFYVALSSSFAGTQEYMAMEKLGQLHKDAQRTGRWDLIVVDTPPSRSALDFLDAPERLSGFLDGRFIRLLLAPARGPAKLMTAGLGVVTNAMAKVLGAQVLKDMQTFVAAFDTLFGGFRQRAQKTFELLQADGTAFLVVAAPEPDALREAAYFVERLEQEQMPLAGLVVNRATRLNLGGISGEQATGGRREGDRRHRGPAAAARRPEPVVAREARLRQRFAAAHPHVPTAVVPALSTDVHDLDGLRLVGELLAG